MHEKYESVQCYPDIYFWDLKNEPKKEDLRKKDTDLLAPTGILDLAVLVIWSILLEYLCLLMSSQVLFSFVVVVVFIWFGLSPGLIQTNSDHRWLLTTKAKGAELAWAHSPSCLHLPCQLPHPAGAPSAGRQGQLVSKHPL